MNLVYLTRTPVISREFSSNHKCADLQVFYDQLSLFEVRFSTCYVLLLLNKLTKNTLFMAVVLTFIQCSVNVS